MYLFFADREQQRRDNGGGDNEARNAEPPVNANQQQGMDSDATGRIPPLPVVIPVANTRPAPPPEVPIPPPRRDTPAGGVRPRSRPQPRHPKRRPGSRNNRKTTSDVPSDSRTSENWQLVGRDLRKIADNFRTSRLEVGEYAVHHHHVSCLTKRSVNWFYVFHFLI